MEKEGVVVVEEGKSRKRKRSLGFLSWEQRWPRIEELKHEMEGLFRYYRQLISTPTTTTQAPASSRSNLNGMVALLMEESELPLSELVDFIHHKLELDNKDATTAMVKTAVLSVGHRVCYGLPDPDADLLEDLSPSSLWCWETGDLKLMPKSLRAQLKVRRTCRKKIHDRITAISALITALQKSENDQNYESDKIKASDRLGKVLGEADIRLLVDGMLQKNGTERADKEAEQEVKLLTKQLEKNKKENEREKKRADLELQKEKRQNEKEQKWLLEEAKKDEKRREKEESEIRKQLRKQQEEAEKEQRRREKEELELKKRLAIQKQASIMERFLNRTQTNSPCQDNQTLNKTTTPNLSIKQNETMAKAATRLIDCTLSLKDDIAIDDIRKSHLSSWRHLGHSVRLNRKQHWSIRQKPKAELFKELKLTATRELPQGEGSAVEKLVSAWAEQTSDDRLCITGGEESPSDVKQCKRRKQLLQFDKSYRPAFYGIWPKRSCVVGPRHPFRKDPDLDYDVDSDEEWEEEDPGESLSDCDKDDEEEKSLEEGCSKADDEESEDGFFVPDGYLSENEGVQVDRMETDVTVEVTGRSPSHGGDSEHDEFWALLRQQKYVNNLTESALRKNQTLIISNVMHEKLPSLLSEDLTGTSKLEKACLQALSIRAFPDGQLMSVSVVTNQTEDEDACLSNGKASTTPVSTLTVIQDSDMPIVVSAIQSCSQRINKLVETLQQKFPNVSKSQLRNKVRQISDYVDNHWQVKKEILGEVGLPEKDGRIQNISTFFSKRCLPPADKSTKIGEASPEPTLKYCYDDKGQQACSNNDLNFVILINPLSMGSNYKSFSSSAGREKSSTLMLQNLRATR